MCIPNDSAKKPLSSGSQNISIEIPTHLLLKKLRYTRSDGRTLDMNSRNLSKAQTRSRFNAVESVPRHLTQKREYYEIKFRISPRILDFFGFFSMFSCSILCRLWKTKLHKNMFRIVGGVSGQTSYVVIYTHNLHNLISI